MSDSTVQQGALKYEGKAKKMFETQNPDQLLVVYKDDATAFNGEKKGAITGKGKVNAEISARLFQYLESKGVPTHFIEQTAPGHMLVKAVTIVPVEVIIRNVATGSMHKRLGVTEGRVFQQPVLEFCYKNDALGDPLVNDDHVIVMEWATPEQLLTIRQLAKKVNDLLKPLMLKMGLTLVDFKMEFGLYQGQVILADEISPDTCRLWDVTTGRKLDKDRFRQDLGEVEEAYQEVMGRMRKVLAE